MNYAGLLLVLAGCQTDDAVRAPTPPPSSGAAQAAAARAQPSPPTSAPPLPQSPPPSPAPSPAPPPPPPEVLDDRFVAAIRDAATAYVRWGRVDELPNIAPILCRLPKGDDFGRPARPRMSRANDALHGAKLYYLWASDRDRYLELGRKAVRPGFTIVKESFHAEPAPGAGPEPGKPALRPRTEPLANGSGEVAATAEPTLTQNAPGPLAPIRTLWHEGKQLQVGDPAGLYVMKKLGAKARAGTDAGWIYGTLTAAGEVTSAGRVASCIGCHERAAHDRLFGLHAR